MYGFIVIELALSYNINQSVLTFQVFKNITGTYLIMFLQEALVNKSVNMESSCIIAM